MKRSSRVFWCILKSRLVGLCSAKWTKILPFLEVMESCFRVLRFWVLVMGLMGEMPLISRLCLPLMMESNGRFCSKMSRTSSASPLDSTLSLVSCWEKSRLVNASPKRRIFIGILW